MTDFGEWARRWNVPPHAMNELFGLMQQNSIAEYTDGSEQNVQQKIRLAASKRNAIMWRNNSGACADSRGRFIRFGLGNDSKRINTFFKSSDLIGITPLLIKQHHVGRLVGVFTACEVKKPTWVWSGTDREQAQYKYLGVVANLGGVASFVRSVQDYEACLSVLD